MFLQSHVVLNARQSPYDLVDNILYNEVWVLSHFILSDTVVKNATLVFSPWLYIGLKKRFNHHFQISFIITSNYHYVLTVLDFKSWKRCYIIQSSKLLLRCLLRSLSCTSGIFKLS